MGVAWLPYIGYFIGDRTGFRGVRTVSQGSYVEVRPDRAARVEVWSVALLVERSHSTRPGDLVEEVGRAIADHLRVVVGLPAAEKVAGLTGGKDTRLILAVLLSEGLTDAITFRTLGSESLPDVVVARELGEHFSLNHQWGFTGPAAQIPFSVGIRSVVQTTSGMLSIWEAATPALGIDGVSIAGLGGEALRTNYPATSNVKSDEELERRFRDGWRFGAPGLMRAEVHQALERESA